MGPEWMQNELASQIGIVVALVLGGLHIFTMRRFLFGGHQHQWKTVTDLGYDGCGWEALQVCKCKARRKIQFWPPG